MPDTIDLDDSIGYTLKLASAALNTAMDAALRPWGMSIARYATLEQLAQRPGLSQSELARAVFVTRQSMNVLLHALERDGLVGPTEHETAGRAIPMRLTAAGESRLRDASAAVRAVERRMTDHLDDAGHRRLLADLRACQSALGAPTH